MKLSPHHVGLTVPDLALGKEWYRRVLGFEEKASMFVDEVGLTICLLEKDGYAIEMFGMESTDRQEPRFTDVGESLPFEGWRHIAFRVDNIGEALAETLQLGAEKVADPIENSVLGYAYAFIRDPFGNLIEFVELLKK